MEEIGPLEADLRVIRGHSEEFSVARFLMVLLRLKGFYVRKWFHGPKFVEGGQARQNLRMVNDAHRSNSNCCSVLKAKAGCQRQKHQKLRKKSLGFVIIFNCSEVLQKHARRKQASKSEICKFLELFSLDSQIKLIKFLEKDKKFIFVHSAKC